MASTSASETLKKALDEDLIADFSSLEILSFSFYCKYFITNFIVFIVF